MSNDQDSGGNIPPAGGSGKASGGSGAPGPAAAGAPAPLTPPATPPAGNPVTELNLAERPDLDAPKALEREYGIKRDGGGPASGSLREIPYNADQSRDNTRETVTLWLIGLLCSIIALAFAALYARGIHNGFDDDFFGQLKQLTDVLIGPVITLLSSAVGFYFGYQQGTKTQQQADQNPPVTQQ